MSINTIKGPLIQSDVNNDNNTTRIMEVDTFYATIISDGIATIENGYISDLANPINDNEIATKYYVDNTSGSIPVGPNNSVQYNSGGSFGGSSNLTLTNPGSSLATLNINGTLTNGIMTLTGSQFSGLDNPTSPQQAATKNYVDETVNTLGVISLNLKQNVTTVYTPAQVYNNIVNIDFDPNNILSICGIDSMPIATDMKTFLGSEFIVGKTWTTIFSGPKMNEEMFIKFSGGIVDIGIQFSPIIYYFCGLPRPATGVINYSNVTVTSVITNIAPGSEFYYSYVSNIFNDITTNAQITDQGIKTPSLGNSAFLGTGTMVYQVPTDPSINSGIPITYTYGNLQQYLIIRTGLIANTSDTFVSASIIVSNDNFIMGGGTFKFFIQNPTLFDLTLVPSSGWSFQSGSSSIIPAGNCGCFWVSVIISPASCKIITMGINPING